MLKLIPSNSHIKKSATVKSVVPSDKTMDELHRDLAELEAEGGFKLMGSGNMHDFNSMSAAEIQQQHPFMRKIILQWQNSRQ